MDLLKNLDDMITAEEFYKQTTGCVINHIDIKNAMIEFAKLHAVEILKKLSKTEMEYQRNIQYVYPLSNIK